MNKKAQGLSTNAIILIVLGVVVLVILIAGFTMGWSNIAPWLSSENVGTIVTSCETACSTNNVYAFCSKERQLIDAEKNKIKTSCFLFSQIDSYSKYAVEKCQQIDCELECGEFVVIDAKGEEIISELKGDCGESLDLTNFAKGVDETNPACCLAIN